MRDVAAIAGHELAAWVRRYNEAGITRDGATTSASATMCCLERSGRRERSPAVHPIGDVAGE
jgi:hypothetical protein